MVWSNGLAERSGRTHESHYPGADQQAPVGCGTSSFLVDRDCGHGGLPEAARSSIHFTEEDTVRNIIWEAAPAVASATDWLPCMGVDPERASSKTRTQIVRVPVARLL
jgi:hypothetical protein